MRPIGPPGPQGAVHALHGLLEASYWRRVDTAAGRIVARDLTDVGNGCMGTMFQVRQVGVGAAFDAFCDEAALRHYWPRQAEAALQRFDDSDPQPMR